MQEPIVTILGELVAINSINPTLSGGPGEKDIAGFIRDHLSGRGFEVQVQTVAGERANVAALVRGNSRLRALYGDVANLPDQIV